MRRVPQDAAAIPWPVLLAHRVALREISEETVNAASQTHSAPRIRNSGFVQRSSYDSLMAVYGHQLNTWCVSHSFMICQRCLSVVPSVMKISRLRTQALPNALDVVPSKDKFPGSLKNLDVKTIVALRIFDLDPGITPVRHASVRLPANRRSLRLTSSDSKGVARARVSFVNAWWRVKTLLPTASTVSPRRTSGELSIYMILEKYSECAHYGLTCFRSKPGFTVSGMEKNILITV